MAMTVIIPELPSLPEQFWGKTYRLGRLLTPGDANPKLAKSLAGSYSVCGLTLAPATEAGVGNLCPRSTAGCRAACLYRQGRGITSSVALARIARTLAFAQHRQWFLDTLHREIAAAHATAAKMGKRLAVRLNVTSDIAWEKVFPELFAGLADVVFYDYTKVIARAVRYARGQLPANYHLTFSRSEDNDDECLTALSLGVNVAVVFGKHERPGVWHGYPVIDGDASDLRFLDHRPAVVGLTPKGSAAKDTSGFVLRVNVNTEDDVSNVNNRRRPLPLLTA